MVSPSNAYLPIDRRDALTRGASLPERDQGAALFADMSGFTRITEALTRTQGARRGIEALTQLLDRYYDDTISAVERYGGAVIGFSGDAITCWFGGEGAAARALTAAEAMQRAVSSYSSMDLAEGEDRLRPAMKIGLGAGTIRRFLVGDPAIQLIEVIAGEAVIRASLAETVAKPNEMLIDAAAVKQLGDQVTLGEWRRPHKGAPRFAVVNHFTSHALPQPWPRQSDLPDEAARPWLLPAVYERLMAGTGEFMTELRPAVALFLRFEGVDYTSDPQAADKLDRYLRHVQHTVQRYDGTLIQLTVGEKGSYLYAAFGAPRAHDDDARRAVAAALELRRSTFDFLRPVQIGISQGIMRTGAYGSQTRRTFGVLGDEVNLAARLMQHAEPGEILASGRVQEMTAQSFVWQPLPSLVVKGKRKPVPLARLLEAAADQASPRRADAFDGLFVGRQGEIARLIAHVEPITRGLPAGLAAVLGEPGVGKSRLIHEFLEQYERQHPGVIIITLETDDILQQSLQPFKPFLRRTFDQQPGSTDENQRERFETAFSAVLADIADETLRANLNHARPFLAMLVDLDWDSPLLELLDPALRRDQNLAAVRHLLAGMAARAPLILVVEDAQWLDDDSRQVLEDLLARGAAQPIAVLVSGRDGGGLPQAPPALPTLHIPLSNLGEAEVMALAADHLGGEISDELAQLLVERTNGNPFFVEQLAHDLRQRSHLLHDEDGAWQLGQADQADIPDSINTVVMARLDRLAPNIKVAVQIAAVLGKEFDLPILAAVLGGQTDAPKVVREGIAEGVFGATGSSTRWAFRHLLVREAAYQMQPSDRLRDLHARAAAALEAVVQGDSLEHVGALVFHYHRAEDSTRERQSALRAGAQAARQYANADALRYLTRALELTDESERLARLDILAARERVLDIQADRRAQREDLSALHALAAALGDDERLAETALRQANYAEVTGDYQGTFGAAQEAMRLTRRPAVQASGHLYLGRALGWQGDFLGARRDLDAGLALARANDLKLLEADFLRNLGIVAFASGQYDDARIYQEQALALSRQLNDRRGEGSALNNLGAIAREQDDSAAARALQEKALEIMKETGDRRAQNSVMAAMGQIALTDMNYGARRAFFQQTLQMSIDIGNRRGEIKALNNLGALALEVGRGDDAEQCYQQALGLSRETGYARGEIDSLIGLSRLSWRGRSLPSALELAQQALELAQNAAAPSEEASALTSLGHIHLQQGAWQPAYQAFEQAAARRAEMAQEKRAAEALAGMAAVRLAQNDAQAGRPLVEDVLSRLTDTALEDIFEPAWVFLVCYRVLLALRAGEARAALRRGYELVQLQASQLEDDAARARFFSDIPANREIMAAWAWTMQG